MPIEPIPLRTPYNAEYCQAVNCQHLARNRFCVKDRCIRKGAEKWPAYFTEHGVLADGDEIGA